MAAIVSSSVQLLAQQGSAQQDIPFAARIQRHIHIDPIYPSLEWRQSSISGEDGWTGGLCTLPVIITTNSPGWSLYAVLADSTDESIRNIAARIEWSIMGRNQQVLRSGALLADNPILDRTNQTGPVTTIIHFRLRNGFAEGITPPRIPIHFIGRFEGP